MCGVGTSPRMWANVTDGGGMEKILEVVWMSGCLIVLYAGQSIKTCWMVSSVVGLQAGQLGDARSWKYRGR